MTDLRHNRALTLVEILVVVSIIAVLATFAITLTLRVENQSKENALANAFALLETALQEYHEYKGEFPAQPVRDPNFAAVHAELMYEALRSVPASREVLTKINTILVKGDSDQRGQMHDVWGTALDYIYVPGDNFPELISAGPDRLFDTGDDISNQDL
ncbi:MAG: type II secretion system protein [Sedimentisphaerales bacterium]|nr:type II secretion system protein [Sedimentisphaerales bacterium]